MSDLIKTEILPGLFLAESEHNHQIIENISLGDNKKPYSKEVADWVAGLRKRRNDLNIPFENLQRFISTEQEKYAPHFNDSGTDPKRWSDYFQKMWDNLQWLIPQKRQELRETVYKMVEDRFRGPKFTRQFLEVLLEVFADYRSRFDQDKLKDWLPRERSAQNALQSLLKQIDDHAKQFLPINRKNAIEEDFRGIMQALESIYTSKVEIKARTLGVLLLDALREEIEQLLMQLTALDQVLGTLQAQLHDKEKTYVQETGTLTVNGILLYDEKEIDQVYRKTLDSKEDTICQSLSQQILDELGLRLFDFYTFDTLRVRDLYERLLNQSIDIFRSGSQMDISTARKFLEQYPTLEQQEAQIRTTFEKSEPFLRFSKEQKSLGWEDKPEKSQRLVGTQGGHNPADPAVKAILPMIRKTSTVTDKEIRPLEDPYHIYFVQEIGAFPLRMIEGMEKMRTIYRSIAQSPKQNSLHTHKDQRQFKDMMPATQNEMKIRHNLVLAKAMQLVKQEENRVNGFTEIKFFYQDKQTGLDKVQVLGTDWYEAEEYLLTDQNRKLGEILDDAIRSVGEQATTKSDKQALYQMLMTYRNQVEATIPGGKDSPDYKKVEAAIADYIKTHGLYIGEAASSTVPTRAVVNGVMSGTTNGSTNGTVPTTETPENLEKFTKLVETCHRRGKPSATELDLLEKFRQKYSISQATADRLMTQFHPQANLHDASQQFSLMFRAFLENDGGIDLDEQTQLLDLQEELGLTNEQVSTIETNIRKELALN